jgi:hypothetical protein
MSYWTRERINSIRREASEAKNCEMGDYYAAQLYIALDEIERLQLAVERLEGLSYLLWDEDEVSCLVNAKGKCITHDWAGIGGPCPHEIARLMLKTVGEARPVDLAQWLRELEVASAIGGEL